MRCDRASALHSSLRACVIMLLLIFFFFVCIFFLPELSVKSQSSFDVIFHRGIEQEDERSAEYFRGGHSIPRGGGFYPDS